MIRDTSHQDRVVAGVGSAVRRRILVGVALAAVIAAVGFGARRWMTSARSVDAGRIRIAEVRRDTLVRDVVADGRVTAANSPTLYAVAAGIVTLEVAAGDAVAKGDALATIASPELESRLTQERATLAGLEARRRPRRALVPFYSTRRGGTGLGLALVREIAEAHGGRVALANRDGGGLTVSIVLPQ